MTQEEKAKAYDESLERAKKLYEQGTITESLSYVFPELKESEDERIRRDIIRYLKKTSPAIGENIEKMLAWLEKQGEFYTKRDVDNAYIEGMAFAKDELEKQGEQKLPIGKLPSEMKTIGESLGFTTQEECDKYNQMVTDLIMSDDGKSEQKPTDKEMKTLLRTEYEKGRADAIAEMQSPAWSEEDEEELDIAVSTLKEAGQHDSAKWLKSLKERCTWTRKDTFIEKACEFMRNNINKQLTIYHDNTWCKRDEFIEKFCKYMRGE